MTKAEVFDKATKLAMKGDRIVWWDFTPWLRIDESACTNQL